MLAPLGRDGPLTVEVLRKVGLEAESFATAAELSATLAQATGVAIIAEEALEPPAITLLSYALAAQPSWSDLPLLVFASSRPDAAAGSVLLEQLAPLGNVSLLERPIRVATLLSAVSAALRSRRRQYELRSVLQRLQQAVRQRDQFLAILGHELRNPLSAALLASENLSRLAALPQDQEALQHTEHQRGVIRRQLEVLTRLVDDLLDVSRVTSGKVNLRRERVELDQLIAKTIEAAAPLAQQQRLQLRFAGSDEPLFVVGDPVRLEQVVSNLLRNSIKYTPPQGEITVTLQRDQEQAVITVRDTGVGIEPETLLEIFELFKQADHTLHRAQGGLGIGLTLVRRLVDLHAGEVVARSEGLGRGSEFEVRLPLTQAEAIPADRAQAPALAEAPGGLILVVEDHADSREGLVGLLRRLGYEVESEGDGATGAARILERAPRAAIVDIGLPGVDGYEVARRVRAGAGDSVMLIALTGYGLAEDRKLALQAGFDSHVTKPVDLERLRSLLATGRPRTPA